MFKKALTLLLFSLIAFSLYSQTPPEPDWYINKPIEDIRFSGLDAISFRDLEGVVKPYLGQSFTNELFWELQSKLYALDFFEEIVPNAEATDDSFSKVVIRFQVKERPTIAELKFEGNSSVRTGEILDTIMLKRGDMITNAKIRIDEQAIKDLYLNRGFTQAKVSSNTTESESGDHILTFSIVEGIQTTIRTIQFSGNDFASEGTLEGVMKSKEQSLFSSGVFNELKFEHDKRLIEQYYADRGYIDAKVVEVRKEVEVVEEENKNYLVLTLYIEEGEQYTYGGITFSGNSIFSTEQLQQLVRLQEGQIINESRLDTDYQKVLDLYYENGYIFNIITREEERDDANRVISYSVAIVEKNRAHIENIIIKGNEKTKDFVLYREIPLEVGDVFSKGKIIEGMRNLYNLQYFSSVAPETPQGSADGLMDLVLNVEETNTADIRFGVVFGGSADFPVSANVKWTDNNFMGQGQVFSVNLTGSPVEQTLGFSFLEKWLMGERWSGGLNLSVSHKVTGNSIPQDTAIDGVVFKGDEDNAVPDNGLYTGQWVDANTGKPVSNPSKSQIDNRSVVTDYEYARSKGFSIPKEYLMGYDSWDISLGGNTGYRFRTPIGNVNTNTSLGTTLTFINYDESLYRPFDPTTRENRGQWKFVNKWSVGAAWDTRDLLYSPASGHLLSQKFIFTGGFLFGSRHYIRSVTKGEIFFTLFDIPVFDQWNFKWVLAAHSQLSVNLDQFWTPDGNNYQATAYDQLYVDGYFVGRGWSSEPDGGGRTLWDNWIELRMPLAEQIVWWDTFFDFPAYDIDVTAPWEIGLDNFRFGIGSGVRFVIPQFPIRMYLAKRFKFTNNQLEWQKGPLWPDDLGWDFVFTIGYDLY